jgi:hypothetical protein
MSTNWTTKSTPPPSSTCADWREQQDRCLREIERYQSADQHYLEEGITILEMARGSEGCGLGP